ncbi:MAG: M28 family peptidase [Hyphomicrobium sp.]|nr:M28 family peptidase [Hyphomicrobium sp.]
MSLILQMLSGVAVIAAILAVALTGLVCWSVVFPRQPLTTPLPPPNATHSALAERLYADVAAIASEPHSLSTPKRLEAAAHHIETKLEKMGYAPERQGYEVEGQNVRNIEVVIEPRAGNSATQTLVIGAHYDSAGDAPGAHDNGTGVAATLALADRLRTFEPEGYRLRLVFWVNEEQPWSKTLAMGSWQHARRLREKGEIVMAAISLETLGYFSDAPGSQRFPWPFGLIYPDTGNFVAFVGLPRSRAVLREMLAAFRRQKAFPSIGGVAPGFIDGIDHSDHWAYDREGFPAFMITDTAPFRNPYYHSRHDKPETVDYLSLARITLGVEAMIREVAAKAP